MQIKNYQKLLMAIATLSISGLMQNDTLSSQPASTPVQKDMIQLAPATVRTPQEMEKDNNTPVNPPPQAIPFRPTIDPETYQKLKDAAEQERTSNCTQRSLKTNPQPPQELPHP